MEKVIPIRPIQVVIDRLYRQIKRKEALIAGKQMDIAFITDQLIKLKARHKNATREATADIPAPATEPETGRPTILEMDVFLWINQCMKRYRKGE